MNNKTLMIALFSLGVTLVALAMIAISYAWLSKQLTITSNTVSVGEILYVKSGSWISPTEPIVPNTDLIAEDFILDNQSSIPSQMRVIITYTKYASIEDVTGTVTTYSNTLDHISVSMPTEFVYSSGYWYYTATDYSIPAVSGPITIVSSLYFDGDIVSIDYASKNVTITITIQVKQANNVTWNDLTSYNFETGLPA
ncbi:MAG: hypothetical protein CVV56_05540 [Tenericutes bacterium HGW-Tenericutes-1]|nr:MAG: hypothetical protein CVV58_00365 [Tenericutes bacterium HGW-Tenericutes-3]PKL00582.1 MAG: hypothetical protein CVV56_05540 [Tenericutes bacterium HGW-Tenericutes-1]